jgi:flap endonuclease-1
MGIHGLMKLLSDECPGAIREQELNNLTGRKIAIDASMAMYQFLVAVRSSDGGQSAMLTNEAGEVTSHIQGMFNRTIKFLSAGVKVAYVFDGKPPDFKSGELAKRLAKRAQAEADLATAKESGENEDIDKFSRRLVKVTKQHNDDCKMLLSLMGVPVINAPCEAEAQCAELAKKGKVYATATEDMDALTFRTPKLLRKLTFSAANKQPIVEIDLELALKGLQLTYEQFIDLCILCGCDYLNTIKGIGPKTALKLIRAHTNLEGVVRAIAADKKKKYQLPKEWTTYRMKKEVDTNLTNDSSAESKDADAGVKSDDISATVSSDMSMELESKNNESETVTRETKSTALCKGDEDDDGDIALVDSDDEMNIEDDGDDDGLLQKISDSDMPLNNVEEGEDDGSYEVVPPLFIKVRELFSQAEVYPAEDIQLKWEAPKEEELKSFLVDKMGFNEERVKSGIKKLMEAQQKKSQQRMDRYKYK